MAWSITAQCTHQAIVNMCQERIAELEEENKALKEAQETEASAPKSEPDKTPKTETLDNFVRRVRNQFILTSEPICNHVEGWQKETTFYINSYGKLSLTTKNKEFSQLNDPILINKFWKWLMKHQERIGDIVEFKSKDIKSLNGKYKNKTIQINNQTMTIEEIVPIDGRFSLKIRGKNGKVGTLYDMSRKPKLFELEELERDILM